MAPFESRIATAAQSLRYMPPTINGLTMSSSLAGDQQWKNATFRLPRARFLNSQNRGADFRLVLEGTTLAVARVELKRLTPRGPG